MLIDSHRHTRRDLEHWRDMEALDHRLGGLDKARRLEEWARKELLAFALGGRFFVGVSWGKDSVVVAHLAATALDHPTVAWFPAGEIENPDCYRVRDAFLATYGDRINYHEVPATLTSDEWDRIEGHDGAQAEFARVARAFGDRYASGVRAEESGVRKMAMRRHGMATGRTCRPIGWWQSQDVYAYLARHDLPVHPAYAMTMGGALDRGRLRVSTIGGQGGANRGRREWEETYYGDEIERIFAPRA